MGADAKREVPLEPHRGALFGGKALIWTLPIGITLFPWTIRLDPLSAYFNLTLALLALAVSVFSAGYLREMEATRNLGVMGFFYNILLLSLTLVFAAANAFFFLIAWEMMAIAAFCLVTFEHEQAEVRRAGDSYVLVDLDSTNGVEVGGKRVKRLDLSDGSRFTIGSTEIVFSEELA